MILLYFIFGFIGGVFGGMGMGGGTFLIPLLTLACGVPQITSQAVNLFAFLPMSFVALILHVKNGLADVKIATILIVPALVFAVIGAFLAQYLDAEILKKAFGAFLVFLSACAFIGKSRKVS